MDGSRGEPIEMPHKHRALQALINDPNNWMMGEMPGGPKSLASTLGKGQALPVARDAVEMLKRLQGGLSRVPTRAKQLIAAPAPQQFRFNPQQSQMMDRMYQEANPVFKRMQAAGMFDRTLR